MESALSETAAFTDMLIVTARLRLVDQFLVSTLVTNLVGQLSDLKGMCGM